MNGQGNLLSVTNLEKVINSEYEQLRMLRSMKQGNLTPPHFISILIKIDSRIILYIFPYCSLIAVIQLLDSYCAQEGGYDIILACT